MHYKCFSHNKVGFLEINLRYLFVLCLSKFCHNIGSRIVLKRGGEPRRSPKPLGRVRSAFGELEKQMLWQSLSLLLCKIRLTLHKGDFCFGGAWVSLSWAKIGGWWGVFASLSRGIAKKRENIQKHPLTAIQKHSLKIFPSILWNIPKHPMKYPEYPLKIGFLNERLPSCNGVEAFLFWAQCTKIVVFFSQK